MKCNSILIAIILCVFSQSVVIIGAQNPPMAESSWWSQRLSAAKEWVSKKLYPSATKAYEKVPTAKSLATGAVAGMAGGIAAYPEIGKGELTTAQYLMLSAGVGIAAIIMLRSLINTVMDYYNRGFETEEQAVQKIKDAIRAILSNEVVYPTRFIKIFALKHNRAFIINYPGVAAEIINQACEQLISEISQQSVGQEEARINRHIKYVKDSIHSYPTTQQKINALKQAQGFPFALAYISEYLRLKNKLAVEQQSAAGVKNEK